MIGDIGALCGLLVIGYLVFKFIQGCFSLKEHDEGRKGESRFSKSRW